MNQSPNRLAVLVAVLMSAFSVVVYRAAFFTPAVGISLSRSSGGG